MNHCKNAPRAVPKFGSILFFMGPKKSRAGRIRRTPQRKSNASGQKESNRNVLSKKEISELLETKKKKDESLKRKAENERIRYMKKKRTLKDLEEYVSEKYDELDALERQRRTSILRTASTALGVEGGVFDDLDEIFGGGGEDGGNDPSAAGCGCKNPFQSLCAISAASDTHVCRERGAFESQHPQRLIPSPINQENTLCVAVDTATPTQPHGKVAKEILLSKEQMKRLDERSHAARLEIRSRVEELMELDTTSRAIFGTNNTYTDFQNSAKALKKILQKYPASNRPLERKSRHHCCHCNHKEMEIWREVGDGKVRYRVDVYKWNKLQQAII
eukprot:jgi/Bigna1/75812/fgenesh1_pg.37_\